jgi:hypothetical protein
MLIRKQINNYILIYNCFSFETRRNFVLKILGCSESYLRAITWVTSGFLLLHALNLNGGKYEWNLCDIENAILILYVLDTAKSLLDRILRMLMILSD